MRELDLDENDPLRRSPMIGTKSSTVSTCICCLGVPLNNINNLNSISERLHNENLEESSDVSKQKWGVSCEKLDQQNFSL